jgi:hypothetical protein
VLQDDTLVCRHFIAAAERALAAQPNKLVSFYVGGMPKEFARAVYRACDADLSWATLDNLRWCPAIALAWPYEMIHDFLSWVNQQNWPRRFRADDEIIGRWCRARHVVPLATVPSLVEHPDDVPSLIGRRAMCGLNPDRIAACWIHEDADPLSIDWSLGPA